jgi:cellulose biosynthesis protein BcsQ
VISTVRVAAFGDEALRASLISLGFEPVDERAEVVVVDLRDRDAVLRASALLDPTPRVFIAGTAERELCAAIGADPTRIAGSIEPAALGPVVMAALPSRSRSATRVVVVTATRGGLGRTLFVVNVAARLAATLRVCVVDATGTGASAWWLGADAQPWSALAGLVEELTPEQLAVLAEEIRPGLRVIGGTSRAPDTSVGTAVIRAASGLDDLVIVDAPLVSAPLTDALRERADRTLVVAYDDPCSLRALALAPPEDGVWVIASQSNAETLGDHRVFRNLPRDEGALAAAVSARDRVRGALGRAYDEIAEILRIDAT